VKWPFSRAAPQDAESSWISRHVWMQCADNFDLALLEDRRCWGGLDLSSTQDLTAFVLAFEPSEADPFWRLLPHFWLPGEGLYDKGDQDRVPYIAWRDAGHLNTTPGRVINKLYVLREISNICAPYNVQRIAYDRWRIEECLSLSKYNTTFPQLKGFGQGYKDMAPALDEFERLLINQELRHQDNPVMTWCAFNAITSSDPAGNRKVAKDKATGRVDGIVAAIMAIGISIKKNDEADKSPVV